MSPDPNCRTAIVGNMMWPDPYCRTAIVGNLRRDRNCTTSSRRKMSTPRKTCVEWGCLGDALGGISPSRKDLRRLDSILHELSTRRVISRGGKSVIKRYDARAFTADQHTSVRRNRCIPRNLAGWPDDCLTCVGIPTSRQCGWLVVRGPPI